MELNTTYSELKEAYRQATAEGSKTFQFLDITLLTKYAKYLLEYCEINKITEDITLVIEPIRDEE